MGRLDYQARIESPFQTPFLSRDFLYEAARIIMQELR